MSNPQAGGLDALRREWTSNVNTFAPCRSGIVQEYVERVLSALESQEVELGALRTALREIWDSVPASYDDNDPMVRRHAKALNAIPDLLGVAPERDESVPRGDSSAVSPQLVLSLFPGIGLLDMAFEEEGFCVVRGPDLLWGGDVKRFHAPAARFFGVIGGPPCQFASRFRFLNPGAGRHGNLIPEFERIVGEAQPTWFVMENVPDAPAPSVAGYSVQNSLLNNRWLGEEQERLRRFSFGWMPGDWISAFQPFNVEQAALESPLYAHAVTSDARTVPVKMVRDGKGGHKPKRTSLKPPTVTGGHGAPFDRETMSIARMAELQGLPSDFLSEAPFTAHGKRKAIGNGVPLPMGRAVARAVKRALGMEAVA